MFKDFPLLSLLQRPTPQSLIIDHSIWISAVVSCFIRWCNFIRLIGIPTLDPTKIISSDSFDYSSSNFSTNYPWYSYQLFHHDHRFHFFHRLPLSNLWQMSMSYLVLNNFISLEKIHSKRNTFQCGFGCFTWITKIGCKISIYNDAYPHLSWSYKKPNSYLFSLSD